MFIFLAVIKVETYHVEIWRLYLLYTAQCTLNENDEEECP